ncbi:glutathione S-transferase family protein [Novosphingobium mangrovi (ex Huang et al. 2023)]|uniref:Glutathione S-transferase family protein n=1 Tax=Novosphingobium mangrovi (ex Huang et al. 2023) TaxID=2976432 RepID=A0ABT2I845_9SPHN|nr:glutathione S-transferase family protein [Novosphingobium mangrovi (ex Huang et al. 2023)]MCT2400958.1 glutathione S-transferase family protein [Novosphingobium mangrovi (ex Huang et al. 2023)]
MSLELFGHPFSSYTWKALIALYAAEVDFEFRIVDADHPENVAVVQSAGPLGKFPVLRDGENLLFEATTIIDYVSNHHTTSEMLIPADADAATGMRMLDRVFDNYVMAPMQNVVDEYLRAPENPDMARIGEARDRLERVYAWLEGWLQFYPPLDHVTLIECSAAPALFYADWVHPIAATFPRLRRWRTHLLRLPPVAQCVEDARPYRQNFPPGAPDRD